MDCGQGQFSEIIPGKYHPSRYEVGQESCLKEGGKKEEGREGDCSYRSMKEKVAVLHFFFSFFFLRGLLSFWGLPVGASYKVLI